MTVPTDKLVLVSVGLLEEALQQLDDAVRGGHKVTVGVCKGLKAAASAPAVAVGHCRNCIGPDYRNVDCPGIPPAPIRETAECDHDARHFIATVCAKCMRMHTEDARVRKEVGI